MPIFDAGLQDATNGLRGGITHVQMHSSDPGSAGTTNITSSARQPVSFAAATGSGDSALAAAVTFAGAANAGAGWVSFWSAASGGVCKATGQLTGDTSFNAAGQYTLDNFVLNANAL
jgi:hypothetical protein